MQLTSKEFTVNQQIVLRREEERRVFQHSRDGGEPVRSKNHEGERGAFAIPRKYTEEKDHLESSDGEEEQSLAETAKSYHARQNDWAKTESLTQSYQLNR